MLLTHLVTLQIECYIIESWRMKVNQQLIVQSRNNLTQQLNYDIIKSASERPKSSLFFEN